MPFVYDETEIEWPEDGSDPDAPRADQFVYLPGPEYSGISEPVRFSILPVVAATEPVARQAPLVATAAQPQDVVNILRDLTPPSSQEEFLRSFEQNRRQARLRQEQEAQRIFAVIVPVLRALGVQCAYCRYDGGNDEGFAWLDHYELRGGERIEEGVLIQRLYEMKIQDELHAAGFVNHPNSITSGDELSWLKMFVGQLSNEWASLLLGESYGTGASMFGAFTVDLDECTITDGPNAAPVVQNIEIAR
jgi:hypothetical protein